MTVKEKLVGAKVGDQLFSTTEHIERDAMVRYAGASGDFNTIHYNDAAAKAAGLPGVIAHGMLTMGIIGSLVENWLGDVAAVKSFTTRFSAMLVVDGTTGADLTVSGTLAELTEDSATIEVSAVSGEGQNIVTNTEVVVAL
ncbi:MaoC/PaaZ C-terminal domain-containing protein [Neoactinobaculum massilliense]|uniref:MaoC/PaaZ C-terminal domain-containing protein n=1 Tax=Neoactinobaculum massilliense TaxID=2364794 RepID=UPI000F5332D5|nr:MaoC/PaaZ C-terminal domain-containing protein [Neoactinobaculum massilliense]